MPADAALTREMVALVDALEAAGFQPVLVGGMALVILGSRRVTQDFDFVVPRPAPSAAALVETMYRRGLALVTKFTPQGDVLRTVDNPKVAALKVDGEHPDSLPFFSRETGLRVDLLLDFPLSSRDLVGRSASVPVLSSHIRVASAPDLLRLKEIAHADRKSASDASDLEFLRTLVKRGR